MTEFPPSDFLQGHSWTPLHYLHFPPSQPFLLNSISALSQPQSSPIGPYFSPGPPPSSRGTFQLLSTPPQVPRVSF